MPITRPPNSVPGIGRLTDPVARMIVLAAIVWPFDGDRAAAREAASPSISSIPFFLNSPDTPPVSVLITFSRRAMTPAKSTWALTP